LVDANGDDHTWSTDFDDNKLTEITGCKSGVLYQYHKLNDADDWLISPAFNLKAGIEYSIKYWVKESTANLERFEILVGTTTNPSDYTNISPIKSYDKNIGTTWRHEEVKFTPETNGEYHVALHVCSEKDSNKLYLRGFSIKDNITYPAAPSNLTVTPAPDKTLKATINWEIPTTDSDGNSLSQNITGFNIRRNDVVIGSVDGNTTEYVDESVPEPGIYNYQVSALIGDAEGFNASITSGWIGILTAQALPFTENFSNIEFYETFWSTLDVENDAKKNNNSSYPPLANAWCFMSNPMGNAHWAVMYSSRNSDVTDNDWLFSAPLAFPAKGKYKVSFRVSKYNSADSNYNVTVYAGKNNVPENMDIEIGSVTSVTKEAMNPNTDGELHEYEFTVPSAGAYYIGFHSQTVASSLEHQFRMGAFSVEVVELQGEEAMVPPYRSESDENWTDTKELTFILMPGYYHASWATEGEVSVDEVTLDNEFSEEYA
ncbi:MAG: choice-of-anchor J domain-containing protein, partial [Muribaculaceae bacterium]|nr:choice-of-anchor J domain-containing protein [Muribaculaceae bacterium]